MACHLNRTPNKPFVLACLAKAAVPRLPVALPRPEAPRLLLKLNALLLRHLHLFRALLRHLHLFRALLRHPHLFRVLLRHPHLFRVLLRHPQLFLALLRHPHLIKECPLRGLLRYLVGPRQWLLPRPCLV